MLLADEGFQLPSSLASAAQKTAKKVQAWCRNPASQQALTAFSTKLVTQLESAFTSTATKFQARKEKMWGNYHTIRASDKFSSGWKQFLQESPGCEACPIFYQYITDKIFKRLIEIRYPVASESGHHTSTASDTLLYGEANALRYAAGYVCRAVRKSIMSKGGTSRKELLLCLDELLDDEEGGEDDSCCPGTSDWTELINRGGLLRVTDEAFTVFHAVEQVVRQHFRKDQAKQISKGFKDELYGRIMGDEDVQFYWCIVAADMEEEIGTALLQMVVKHWVTIRGFSFAGAWVELYKQRAKKTLQRSKGLRKALFTSKTD